MTKDDSGIAQHTTLLHLQGCCTFKDGIQLAMNMKHDQININQLRPC
jgi:hypothetical protein